MLDALGVVALAATLAGLVIAFVVTLRAGFIGRRPPSVRDPRDGKSGTRSFKVEPAPPPPGTPAGQHATEVSARLLDRVREILEAIDFVSLVPPSQEIVVRVSPPLAPGTIVADAHPVWLPGAVDARETPTGLPRQPAVAWCPEGVVRAEVDCVQYWSGGMGSWYGFVGYFVSLLILVDEGTVWDARAEVAS
jgi:hypothetical protein